MADKVGKKRLQKVYAVYVGDDLISIDTLENLSKEFKTSPESMIYKSYPAYEKKIKNKDKKAMILVEAKEDEDD